MRQARRSHESEGDNECECPHASFLFGLTYTLKAQRRHRWRSAQSSGLRFCLGGHAARYARIMLFSVSRLLLHARDVARSQ
jgi:hypothetical protein